jgi:hypothetical protein
MTDPVLDSAGDPLEQVLRLVAEGRLTAEEAAPILDALESFGTAKSPSPPNPASGPTSRGETSGGRPPRFARIEVVDKGRKQIDMRVPLSLGRSALGSIPGLSQAYVAEIREAIEQGVKGAILDVQDEDGDGVRIVIE